MPTSWIVARRLAASGLSQPRFASPEAIVGWFGAVQSQDMPGSNWGIGQRLAGEATASVVEGALDDGRFLRTHAMRPTWHYILAEDIRWVLGLTSPRVQRLVGTYYRKLDMDAPALSRAADVIGRALEGGRHLTRAELAVELGRSGFPVEGGRDGFLVMYAEFEGLICSGSRRGKTHTYALLDERAPAAASRARDEALAELARRYFQSHGPAQPRDFAWWSGLTVADANEGLAMLGKDVARERIDDADWWWLPTEAAPSMPPSPTIHLLPNYDEYVGSYRDQRPTFDAGLLDGRWPEAVFAAHLVARDGILIGGWKRSFGKGEVTVRPNLLVTLTAAERAAFEGAAAAYGAFLGVPARIEW